mmetsp:Transcript_34688/g.38728  ORF Transcript_34688/g.38728 Transcript_34688/m.38728 type:complete len:94 (-) Transcript_34688:44-325(-)
MAILETAKLFPFVLMTVVILWNHYLSVVMIFILGGKAKPGKIAIGWQKNSRLEGSFATKRRIKGQVERLKTTARRPVTNAKLVYRNTPFLFKE